MTSISSEIRWRPAIAEGIATFLFVFIGAGTVVMTGDLVSIALVHGMAIAALVAATAHLSGGHINPAVTFAAIITQKVTVIQGAQFITFQLAGAILGALLLAAVLPMVGVGDGAGTLGDHVLAPGVEVWQGLIVEIVLTATLVFVVFSAAMDKRGVGNIAPLVIGLAVLVDNFVGVPLTGASMNPARTLGPALIAGSWADHWVYWVGPLLGGGGAALLHKYVFEQENN